MQYSGQLKPTPKPDAPIVRKRHPSRQSLHGLDSFKVGFVVTPMMLLAQCQSVIREMLGAEKEVAGDILKDVVINIEAFEGSSFDVAALRGHPLIASRLGPGGIRVIEAPWIPNGSEWEGCSGSGILAHREMHYRFAEARKGPCDSSLRVVSVTPDQDLISCCGLNLEHIPQLHVASLRARTLREALEEVPPDLLKMWIHVEGPERVLEFVKEKAPDFRLPLDSAHICHTCQFLHRSAEALEVLGWHRQEVEDRVLDPYLLSCAGREIATALSPVPV